MPLRDKSLKPYGSATVHYDSAMPSLRFITTLLQLHHALLRLLLRLRACKPRNPADTRNDIQSKTGPSPECGAGWGGGLDAPGGTAASAPSPKHGAGGCAPRRGYSESPCTKNVGGRARWDNGVRHQEPPSSPNWRNPLAPARIAVGRLQLVQRFPRALPGREEGAMHVLAIGCARC